MADDEDEEINSEATGDDEDDEEGSSTRGKKKLIIIAGVAVVLLLIAIGAGLYFSGMLGGKTQTAATDSEPEEAMAAGKPTLYKMPEFIINLNTGGKRTSFLKITVSLDLPSEELVPKVEALEPRIRDAFNTYLRELRASDLSGASGLYRLREEMIARVNGMLEPDKVNNVLFQEIIVQ